MIYFSGFCLKDEKELFNDYLEDGEFVVSGFSYGAQKAVDYVLNSDKRVDKLQLLSPAYFNYPQKIIDMNLSAFKKDKKKYINNFLKKAGLFSIKNEELGVENFINYNCSYEDLLSLFTFNWEKIKQIDNIKIEVFIGEFDRIVASKKAYEFFKNYAEVYYIKKANHFLRS